MRASSRLACLLVFVVPLACGGDGGDQATKFAGTWTFESGSLAPTCPPPLPALQPFPLTGLSVTFTKIDNSTIELVAGTAGCQVRFGVSGDKATVKPNQTCTLTVPGFGDQVVAIQSWTLMLSGDRIDSTTSGMVLLCSASGSGVLVRGGPSGDAGAD